MNSQVLIDRKFLQDLLFLLQEPRTAIDARAVLVFGIERALLATPAPTPDAGEGVDAHLPDSAFQDEFQAWWEDEGQYVRSGGGTYERSFAFQAWRYLMPKLVSALQASSGDQQAQRIGELEGFLREAPKLDWAGGELDSWLDRIDSALSASNEVEE